MQRSPFQQTKLSIGGIIVNSRIFLGAGVIKNPLALDLPKYLEGEIVGAITIGSITLDERHGNKGVLNWPDLTNAYEVFKKEGGLHANGVRNLGIVETMNNLPTNSPKPTIISLAGYSVEDYVNLLKIITIHKNSSLVSAIEINCSCPTMNCAPLAYSLDVLEELFIKIKELNLAKPLWFKLSPYFTKGQITKLSERYPEYDFSACPVVPENFMTDLQYLLKKYTSVISALVVSNGLPQVGRGSEIQVVKDDGTTSYTAGLSGPVLKAGNLKMIKFMKEQGLELDIIGCGGILSKEDIADYLDVGVVAVQCSGGPIWGGGIEFFKGLEE